MALEKGGRGAHGVQGRRTTGARRVQARACTADAGAAQEGRSAPGLEALRLGGGGRGARREARAADEDERQERAGDDEGLVGRGGLAQEDRQGHPHHVVRVVHDDAGQQAVPPVERAEEQRGQHELDQPRVRGLRRIVGVGGAEEARLEEEAEADEHAAREGAALLCGERGGRERERAEERPLPEAREERLRDGRQPRREGGVDVGVGEGRRGHPPAEQVLAAEVEGDLVREHDGHEEVAEQHLVEEGARLEHGPAHECPQPQLAGEGEAAEALGGGEGEEDDGEEEGRLHGDLDAVVELEDAHLELRRVGHPLQGHLHGHRAAHAARERHGPRRGGGGGQRVAPHQQPAAHGDAHHAVEHDDPDPRELRERLVGGAHALELAREGLGHLEAAAERGEPRAAHGELEPVRGLLVPARVDARGRLAHALGPLEGEGVVGAPRPRLPLLLDQRPHAEVDPPRRAGRRQPRNAERLGGGEVGALLLLRQRGGEAERFSGRREEVEGARRVGRKEVAHPPGEGRVHPAGDHLRKGGVASAAQLDEVLAILVELEGRGHVRRLHRPRPGA